ncbi:hypothetical protein MTR67_000944 [Solanum verrucosum]|nr:hypothetical protein MTR67_000944 [Solanum verrucosum]
MSARMRVRLGTINGS